MDDKEALLKLMKKTVCETRKEIEKLEEAIESKRNGINSILESIDKIEMGENNVN